MNEESKSIWKKSWQGCSRWFRAWLIVVAATFSIVLIVTLFIPGGPRSFSDWWPALVFMLVVSAVVATVFFGLWAFIRCFFSWRNFKRLLFGLACFATLIALFYVEEDWRGWHAWNQYQRTEEAKGGKFDFKDFLPAVVPDDENFAMTPVVASSYNYILTRDGKKIPSGQRDTNLVNRMDFNLGDANWNTNGTGSWVAGTLSNLRPWQELYRDLAIKTNLFPVPPQPQAPAADVLLALSRCDNAIEELRQAGLLPKSRYPLDYETENPAEILLPHLWELKKSSLLLRLRAIAELQNDQSEKAAADVTLGFRLIEAIRTEPIMISHLVRIAMNEIILQPIYEGLANHQWTDAQLVTLDSELAKLDFPADCQLVQKSEIAFNVSEIDYLRHHRDYDSMFAGMGVNHPADSKIESLIYRYAPSGWFFQSAMRECRVLMQYGFAVENDTKTISPRKTDQAVQAEKSARAKVGVFDALNCLRKAFDSDLLSSGNFLKKTARAQDSVNLARTAIALERYRLAHAEFPESLDALAPQFIAKVPHDVIGGQPLKYRRTSDGQFVLYSVGWNEKDDGGVTGYRKGGTAPDFDSGDWVWRYPAK
ncbi:MAG TPA: hypothetical protein DCQ92_15175 [Verrucomicrobia subdivision 3 bacterium]|nr:hypothetical protein [Limisphaerales bacterium]